MKHTQAISVTIPTELAEALSRIQKKHMKNYSAIVTDAVREYVLKEEYSDLSSRLSKAAADVGIYSEEDIDKAVHEVKKSGRASKNNR